MTRPTARHARAGEAGQGLAEFALALPVFLLMLMGILQAGLLFSADLGLTSAMRDAARAAATYKVNGDAATEAACPLVAAQVRRVLPGAVAGFSGERLIGTVTYAAAAGPTGASFATVSISASYAQPLLIPLVGAILDRVDGIGAPDWAPPGDTLVLGASESMRIEGSVTEGTISCDL